MLNCLQLCRPQWEEMGYRPLSVLTSSIQLGFAIDLDLGGTAARIFWADQGTMLIESCNPDGTDRTVHVTDSMFDFIWGYKLH